VLRESARKLVLGRNDVSWMGASVILALLEIESRSSMQSVAALEPRHSLQHVDRATDATIIRHQGSALDDDPRQRRSAESRRKIGTARPVQLTQRQR
jgi:hypothetical protein